MLSNKDKENTNWNYIRENGQVISAREFYRVNVKKDAFLNYKKGY